MSETLYLFQCSGKHRIYRSEPTENVECSRCGEPYVKIADVPRIDGETEQAHHVRALTTKVERVN